MRLKTLLSGVRLRSRTIACNNHVTRRYPKPLGRQCDSDASSRYPQAQTFSSQMLIHQHSSAWRGLALRERRDIVGLGYAAQAASFEPRHGGHFMSGHLSSKEIRK